MRSGGSQVPGKRSPQTTWRTRTPGGKRPACARTGARLKAERLSPDAGRCAGARSRQHSGWKAVPRWPPPDPPRTLSGWAPGQEACEPGRSSWGPPAVVGWLGDWKAGWWSQWGLRSGRSAPRGWRDVSEDSPLCFPSHCCRPWGGWSDPGQDARVLLVALGCSRSLVWSPQGSWRCPALCHWSCPRSPPPKPPRAPRWVLVMNSKTDRIKVWIWVKLTRHQEQKHFTFNKMNKKYQHQWAQTRDEVAWFARTDVCKGGELSEPPRRFHTRILAVCHRLPLTTVCKQAACCWTWIWPPEAQKTTASTWKLSVRLESSGCWSRGLGINSSWS